MQKRFDRALSDLLPRLVAGQSASACVPKLLLAVSGGVDSMTLAELAYNSSLKDRFDFAVVHCNFHLRGEDSDGDEAFVRSWSEARNVRCYVAQFNTVGYAAEHSSSIEMAARDLRYAEFARLCRDEGYAAVAVAHNANDNAETMLLNLVRGTGLKGICGMQALSSRKVAVNDGEVEAELVIIRPLLEFPRKVIEGYAFARGMRWREDRTNSDTSYRRNYIRHEVIPALERLNPSIVRTLNREMQYFSSLGSWKQELFDKLYSYDFNPLVIGQIIDLMESGRTVAGKTFHSPTHRLVTTSDSYVLEKTTSDASEDASSDSLADVVAGSLEVECPGDYSFDGIRFRVELIDWTADMSPKQPAGTICIDAGKSGWPLVIRKWSPGDWMCPLGMKGPDGRPRRKKLSDIFTDLKLNILQKERVLVVAAGGDDCHDVIAVAGLRIDERVRIDGQTKRAAKITLL